MKKEEIIDLINNNPVFHLATLEEGEPRVPRVREGGKVRRFRRSVRRVRATGIAAGARRTTRRFSSIPLVPTRSTR